jgi:hypothetical protein
VIFLTDWNTRENYKWKKVMSETRFVDESKPESEELLFELEAIK